MIGATDYILPAIEIVDSRYVGRGPNGLVDSIADAASCGLVVLGGNPRRLADLDIRLVSGCLVRNGDVVVRGRSDAVLGNPINAVVWLANRLADFGVALEPGDVVLSGSFVKAVPFDAGDELVARFDHGLGDVSLSIS